MNYTVIWQPAAIQELADVWVRAADRAAVTQAAWELEQRLSQEPAAGEDRPGGSRVAFAPPIAAQYEIVEDDRKVLIAQVWSYRVGRKG